jgi:hypothetical protein
VGCDGLSTIGSRYSRGHASRRRSARMGAPPNRHKMRPNRNGSSPAAWNELSRRHAIEMQPSVPHASSSTPAWHPRSPVTPSLGETASDGARRSHERATSGDNALVFAVDRQLAVTACHCSDSVGHQRLAPGPLLRGIVQDPPPPPLSGTSMVANRGVVDVCVCICISTPAPFSKSLQPRKGVDVGQRSPGNREGTQETRLHFSSSYAPAAGQKASALDESWAPVNASHCWHARRESCQTILAAIEHPAT